MALTEGDPDSPKNGEVLGPAASRPSDDSPVGDNYIALISQYTERPDLLINALESHDPGFVKRMNEKAESRSDRMADARFWFGGIQAYSGLVVAVLAALTVLGLLVFAVTQLDAGFWLIIGLAAFYAVTQGGPSGFMELCRGISDLFRRGSNKPN
ncbi:hypothetical protein [Roseovarius pelagicus]|uniref:Holin-X, holin superfamily III n=1 Tax=Roseovarius pelagicus TaxID=2980108 RepID=A0ABY6DCR0_9RHOB|nr:hypothetical protein [Roseovarius pelagicus]UXX83921.1 hypothetical protein N7U68_04490 [Roseovarius pelagicus]